MGNRVQGLREALNESSVSINKPDLWAQKLSVETFRNMARIENPGPTPGRGLKTSAFTLVRRIK